MPKILLIQGANMNLLGIRQPEIYGKTTAKELDGMLLDYAKAKGFELEIFYTNSEGECIDRIIQAYHDKTDALVMNPGGFTFFGKAVGETIKGVRIPYIEVHIANHYARGISSVIAEAAQGVILGLGIQGYFLGLDAALYLIGKKQ
jgi:3-dehydroquinate dehydratase-2